MINFLVLIMSFVSINSYSSDTKMKPGLWEVKMKISSGGKEIDPLAELKKQMDKMPEAQRKMIMDQMAKQSPVKNNLTQVCYTQEMVDSPEKISEEEQEDKDCTHKVVSKTATKVVSTFKCKEGHSGTAVWELKNANNMRVTMDSKDKNGKAGKMEYSAKFLKSKCE